MPAFTDTAVCAEDLWRGYGRQRILRGLSLAVPARGCLAILGPNGSGKSTLLRVLAAALRPARGWVRIHGEDPFAVPDARRWIGFVTHEPMLYGGLSVIENLHLLSTLYGLADGRERAEHLCDLLRIDHRSHPVRGLSRGGQQRAALARALLHRPTVLLLDEAFSGLDPVGVDDLCRILRDFCRGGGTVVLTTHNPVEALSVADTATVLLGGVLAPPHPLDGMDVQTLRAWYLDTAAGATG